jgi:hypothetical protein
MNQLHTVAPSRGRGDDPRSAGVPLAREPRAPRKGDLDAPAGLILLLTALLFAAIQWRAWRSLNDPTPLLAGSPAIGSTPRPAAPDRISRRVVLIIADGMNLDLALQLKTLAGIQQRGVFAELQAAGPTLSKPSYVTWLSGLDPEDSGVRVNRYPEVFPLDSVLARARAAGLSTLGFDGGPLPVLLTLFAPHLTRSYSGPERWPEVLAAIPRADLSVIGLTETDNAGHAFGARSPRYLEAARAVDRRIRDIERLLDLSRDLLVVVNDHGHLPAGGHGGLEREARRLFLLAAGSGVAERKRTAPMSQRDLAPTLTLLLGLEPLSHGRGQLMRWAIPAEPDPRFWSNAHWAALQARLRVESYRLERIAGAPQSQLHRGAVAELQNRIDRLRAGNSNQVPSAERAETMRRGLRLIQAIAETTDRASREHLRKQRLRGAAAGGAILGGFLAVLVAGCASRVLTIGMTGALLALIPAGVTLLLLWFPLGVPLSFSYSGSRAMLFLKLAIASSVGTMLHLYFAVHLPARAGGNSLVGRILAAIWLSASISGAAIVLAPVDPGAALPDLRLLAGRFLSSGCLATQAALAALVLLGSRLLGYVR